jgi:hypothetical protein
MPILYGVLFLYSIYLCEDLFRLQAPNHFRRKTKFGHTSSEISTKIRLTGISILTKFWAQFSMNLTKSKPYAYCMLVLLFF